MHARTDVAHPADPDLDCDVDAVTLTSVRREGRDYTLILAGGFGRFATRDAPDGQDVEVTSMEMAFRYVAVAPDALLARVDALLERWLQTGVPLRFVAAPGKMSLIIETPSLMLPVPRSD